MPAGNTPKLRPPRIILFDAVGTLIFPQPNAGLVYHQFGTQFGSSKTPQEISILFAKAFHRVFLSEQQGQLPTNEELEQQRWREVVALVFDELDVDQGLFQTLWNHFADPRHWSLFPDVAATWHELSARGYALGIASNFDRRLVEICRHLAPLDNCRHLFISTQLGFSKPDLRYFRNVESRLSLQPADILLVGDSWQNDVESSQRCGWQACWINRQNDEMCFNMDVRPGKQDCEIHNLSELLERIA